MSEPDPSDVALLAAYRRHQDLDAFDELVDRYERDLLGLATAFLRDGHAAQDAVQDGFIALSRHAAQVLQQSVQHKVAGRGPGGSLRAWLQRVVRNACIDRLRRRQPVAADELVADLACASDDATPLAGLSDGERRHLVWQAVEDLSSLQRAVVVLRFRDELSYQDIAERLGKSVNHVGVALNKALKKLRTCPRLRAEVQP